MKIRQAVVTSAVETLDGRQGLGLVLCSRGLPEEIRQMAKEFEHSCGSNSNAIYCFKIEPIAGDRWIVMNRAVPDIDYTGRTSHVSHTVAFREEELKQFFQSRNSAIPSAFEFMRNFEWRSSWKDEPKWLEDDDDLDEARTKALDANLFDGSKQIDPKYLLAFDYPDTGLKPKRLAWRFDEVSSEEMLDVFHQAWLCLDPWQGTRKYEDLLDEPEVSMLESWQGTFSTNLLHGRPDPYVWVVLSPEFPELGSRELIEPSNLHPQTPDAIKEKIGHPLGDLFVERCIKGPEIWAMKLLRSKLDESKREFSESVKKSNTDLRDRVAQVLAEMGTVVTHEKGKVENAGEWSLFDKEVDLNNWRQQLQRLENEAQEKSASKLDSFRQNSNPIIHLLRNISKTGYEEGHNEIPLCFSSEWANFEELGIQYRETRRVSHLVELVLDNHTRSHASEEKCKMLESKIAILQGDQSSLQGKLDSSLSENGKLHSDIARLKMSIPVRKKNSNWQLPALIGSSIVAMLLLIWIIFEGISNMKAGQRDSVKSNGDSNQLKRQIGSQAELIQSLKDENAGLKAAQDKAAQDKAAQDKAAQDKAAQDKAAQDKAAQDNAGKKKAARP
jgi:hypothetical protein